MKTLGDVKAAPQLDPVFAGPLTEALAAGVSDVLFRKDQIPVGVTGVSGTIKIGQLVSVEEFARAAGALPPESEYVYASNARYRFHVGRGSISFRRVPGAEELETCLGEMVTEGNSTGDMRQQILTAGQPTGDKALHTLLRTDAASG